MNNISQDDLPVNSLSENILSTQQTFSAKGWWDAFSVADDFLRAVTYQEATEQWQYEAIDTFWNIPTLMFLFRIS